MTKKRILVLSGLIGTLGLVLFLFYYTGADAFYSKIIDDTSKEFARIQKIQKYQREFDQRPFHAHYQNGLDLLEEEKYPEAIVEFDLALADHPKHHESYCAKAECLFELGRFEEVIETTIQGDKYRFCPDSYNKRGKAYEALDRQDEAINEYRLVTERWPDNLTAHNNLGWLYAGCFDESFTDGEKSLHHAQQVSALSVQYPDVIDPWVIQSLLGAAYSRAGDFEKAISCTEQALQIAPTERHELLQDNLAGYRENKPYHRTSLAPR